MTAFLAATGAVAGAATLFVLVANRLDALAAVARLHAERIDRIQHQVDDLRRKRIVAGRSGR